MNEYTFFLMSIDDGIDMIGMFRWSSIGKSVSDTYLISFLRDPFSHSTTRNKNQENVIMLIINTLLSKLLITRGKTADLKQRLIHLIYVLMRSRTILHVCKITMYLS